MWILIDGNNWFARDFFAAGPRCVCTFLNRLQDVLDDRQPDRLAVCWDSPNSFRKELSPSYKSQRGEKPPGFQKSIGELMEQVARLNNVTSISASGFEADDLLATLAQMAVDEGEKAMVFSADQDLHQSLVSGMVNQVTAVTRPGRNQVHYAVLTANSLHDKTGIHPHQWVDYRSLTGDSSDNIKGCHGIGRDSARKILQAFDSLDAFYANPFAVNLSQRQHALLMNFRQQLAETRRLIKLRRDAPLPASWLTGAVV